jgi:phosphoglycolate phosphatase
MNKCNICGSTDFVDVNQRKQVLCAKCGSYERTRVMKLELDRVFPLEKRKTLRCLHIAPERGLASVISSTFADYVPADIDVERYRHIEKISFLDLCSKSSIEALGRFDVILHAHVIEHLPCNYTVALIRLHKQLNAGGRQMFSLPIYGAAFEENLADIGDKERERLFGQFDHVRRFSAVDMNATLGAIFDIPSLDELKACYSKELLGSYNIPLDVFDSWNGHSVLSIAKEDMIV